MALCAALTATWWFVLRPAERDSAAAVSTGSPDEPVGRAVLGRPAPPTQLIPYEGDTLDLSTLRGKPVVLNFWSSTCAPCVKEMPLLESVHQQLRDEVTFVGVDVYETPEQGRPMVELTGVTYQQTVDPTGEVLPRYGGTQLPHTVVLDADGTVVALHNRAITDETTLLDMIEEAR